MSEPTTRRRPDGPLALTLLLGLVVALDPLSIDTALPVAQLMAEGLESPLSSVQLSLSLFVAGMALGQLFHGPASDRFGRRPVMLAALALYFAATVVLALTPGIGTLIVARAVQGFAAAAGQTVSRAIIRDRLDREAASRVLSYVFLILGIAPIFAPFLGAYLSALAGWRAVFWIMAVFAVIALAVHVRFLPETNRAPDPRALDPLRLGRTLFEVAKNPLFRAYVGCSAAAFIVLFAFLIGSPAAMISFRGLSPEVFSLWLAVVMLGNVAGYPTSARLVGRMGLDRLLRIGTLGGLGCAVVLAGLAAAGVHATWAVVAPMTAYLFFFALILPPATAGALSPFPRTAGTASSLLGCAQLGAGAIAGAVIGAFEDGTQTPMVIAILFGGVFGLVSYAAVRRRSSPMARKS